MRRASGKTILLTLISGAMPGAVLSEEPAGPVMELDPVELVASRESPFGPAEGYKAERSATATRLDLAIAETPAAIQVLPRTILDDTGAVRVGEALDYAAGVQQTNSFGNSLDGFLLRGFPANIAEDGVLSDGPVADLAGQRDSAVVERVEVVRGPNTALYGPGSPGGLINVVTKRPLEDRFLRLESEISSFRRLRQTFDGNIAFGGNNRFQARISGAFEESDSFRDWVEGERTVVAPALKFQPGEKWTFAYRGEYLHNEEPFDRGIPIASNGDRLADEDAFFGDPDDGDMTTETVRHQFETEYALSESWSAKLSANGVDNTFEGRATEPVTLFPENLGPNNLLVRRVSERDFERRLWTARAELRGDFDTGPVDHRTLFSFEFRDVDQDRLFSRTNPLQTPFVDISDPDIDTTDLEPTGRSDQSDEVRNHGFVFFDQIRFTGPITVLAGGRIDFVEQRSVTEGETFRSVVDSEETAFSPSIGMIYQLTPQASVFLRYAESFQVNTADGPQGEPLDPREGRGVEGGLRLAFAEEDLVFNATVFDIELDNVPVGDPFTDFSRPSDQRSRGFEAVLQGNLGESVSLVANYTYIDGEIANLQGLEGSSDLQGVPEQKASLFGAYTFPDGRFKGLSLRAGFVYTDERLNTVPQKIQVLGQTPVLGGTTLDASLEPIPKLP